MRRGDMLEQALAHRAARHVGRAAAHPRLARRRRRARRPDRGVRRLEHDVVDAEDLAGDLRGDRDEALPDLGRRELERDDAVGEPAARGRGVVEPLGVHEVLDRERRSRRRASRGRSRQCGPRRRDERATSPSAASGGQRQRGRLAQAAHRGATLSSTWPVTRRSPVSIALRSRISTGSSPHAAASLSIWLSWAKHACAHRTRASPRTAGCWCAPPSRRCGRSRSRYGPCAWVIALMSTALRRRRVGATVEHHAALDVHEGAVGASRGAASRSSPGADARGRGTTRHGRRPSSPDARTAARAGTRAPAGSMSSRAPNAPPTPAS